MSKLEEIENNWEGSGYINDIETRWLISRVKELEEILSIDKDLEAKLEMLGTAYTQDVARLMKAEAKVKELEAENETLRESRQLCKNNCQTLEYTRLKLEAENQRMRRAIEKHRELVGTHHSLPDDFLYAILDKGV